MDIQSWRVETVTGKSIEEATEKLNEFLDLCESQRVAVHETEYFSIGDLSSEERHGFIVRFDRYSQPEKDIFTMAQFREKHSERLKAIEAFKKE